MRRQNYFDLLRHLRAPAAIAAGRRRLHASPPSTKQAAPLFPHFPTLSTPPKERSEQARIHDAAHSIVIETSRHTDKAAMGLFLLQWAVMVALACWGIPHSGAGPEPGRANPSLLLALFLGSAISLIPILLARLYPGRRVTRHTVAAGQMLTSCLLVHLTGLSGGHSETHFHIFVSLAFLSFYLDWTVLLTATAVTLADPILLGRVFPLSIFGAAGPELACWLEHAGWIAFCDIILIASCLGRLRRVRYVAAHQVVQEDLLRKAYSDSLTQLPNRLALQAELDKRLACEKAAQSSFPVMYIDLDRFKQINDAYGHAAGDRVLVEVTERLSACMPKGTMLARIGGDEFVAALPEAFSRELVDALAHELLTALMLPVPLGDQHLHVGASIGVSFCPDHGRTAEELLHNADAAMYTVKSQGRRGFAVFAQAMEKTTQADERVLRSAIANDEFTMHYQPLLDSHGRLESLEALMRWESPVQGMISPANFIPLAESTGLIIDLGRVAIEKVCRQITLWSAAAIPFGRVAINISPQQLEAADFLKELDAVLSSNKAAVGRLTFEITETACAAKPALLAERAAALRARGIQVSLDDFGTGYSSLGRLQDFQFDVLKIDRMFINRLGASPAAARVIEAIINIAHLLGISVVAEGVETGEQLQLLRALECDVMQGFLFSKPLSAEKTGLFLMERADHNVQAAPAPLSRPINTTLPAALVQPSFDAGLSAASRL